MGRGSASAARSRRQEVWRPHPVARRRSCGPGRRGTCPLLLQPAGLLRARPKGSSASLHTAPLCGDVLPSTTYRQQVRTVAFEARTRPFRSDGCLDPGPRGYPHGALLGRGTCHEGIPSQWTCTPTGRVVHSRWSSQGETGLRRAHAARSGQKPEPSLTGSSEGRFPGEQTFRKSPFLFRRYVGRERGVRCESGRDPAWKITGKED